MKLISLISMFTLLVLCSQTSGVAQISGSRGGVHGIANASGSDFRQLQPEVANSYITIQGRSEARIEPTQLRVVLAVITDDETSLACGEKMRKTIDPVKKDWEKQGIAKNDINEDFISVLPIYEWIVEGNTAIESKIGYRMQTNLHIKVSNEEEAMEVLEAAFRGGITDVIAVDYWSEEIEKVKAKTLQDAISAARAKAKTLLAIFDEQPEVINVQEETKTIFPSQLYKSFSNTYDSSAQRPNRRDVTFFSAHRPKNTYYEGLQADVDSGNSELVMKRQISVLSTVQIYYRSPGAEVDEEQD